MYKSQADAVKDWLQAYRANEDYIDVLIDKLTALRSSMMSVGVQRISDMPKGNHTDKDALAEYMIRVESLENQIKYCVDIQEQGRKVIKDLAMEIRQPEAGKIIMLRYLNGYEWPEIFEMLYKPDKLDEKAREACRRRMYRAHKFALKEMAKNWK